MLENMVPVFLPDSRKLFDYGCLYDNLLTLINLIIIYVRINVWTNSSVQFIR